MKTSEFKKRVEQMGYVVEDVNSLLEIKVQSGSKAVSIGWISTYEKDEMGINTINFKLAKICVEYAETPIHEREDVKKYIAKIPDPENLSTERIYTLVRAFNGSIMISRPQTKRILENEAYHLTEEEIKRNHAYLWEFAEEVN